MSHDPCDMGRMRRAGSDASSIFPHTYHPHAPVHLLVKDNHELLPGFSYSRISSVQMRAKLG